MPLIRQMVKKNYRSNDIVATAADVLVITGMLEGEVTTLEERSAGGVDLQTVPAQMNVYKLGINRKADDQSCTVSIPHLKSTRKFTDILSQIALFDAHWESSLQATGMRLIYGGKQ